MKKDSNGSLFFLLGIGIVGLGLYYGAASEYSPAEIQLYHFICWIVLIVAFLRFIELIWKPVKALWDHVWGRVWDAEASGEKGTEQKGKDRLFYSDGFERRGEQPFEKASYENSAENCGSVGSSYDSFVRKETEGEKKVFQGEPVILDEQGRRVIIVPDSGPRLSLGDRYAEAGNRYAEPAADCYRAFSQESVGIYHQKTAEDQKNGSGKKDKKKSGKKKKKA